jgi:hypothetical protein
MRNPFVSGNPCFVAQTVVCAIGFLNKQKIVRPGYTTFQAIIVDVLSAERKRLGNLIEEFLDDAGITALKQLLVREDNRQCSHCL